MLCNILQLSAGKLLGRYFERQLRVEFHSFFLAKKSLIGGVEVGVRVELIIGEDALGGVAEGTLHLGLALRILGVVIFEAGVTKAVVTFPTGQYPYHNKGKYG